MWRPLFGAALCVLGSSACANKQASHGPDLVLAAAPADLPIRLGVDFDGGIELLGAKLQPTQGLKPGSRVELTLYWRRKGAVARGFRLFTHVLDEAGERILNLDGVGALRKEKRGKPLLPPSDWEQDKVYVDQQTFSVPLTLRTDSISIVAGLYRDGERLGVRRGVHHGDRALVAKLPVARAVAPASSSLPILWVPRKKPEWPLVIDGKLTDASWTRAASTGQFVSVGTGQAPAGNDVSGSAKLIYDDTALYLAFEVFDEDVRGGFDPTQADPHLWLKDTVEIMIDPDGDGDNLDYYEVQVGPQNLVFDSQFDAYNLPRVEPQGPFGHQEWSANLKSAVELRGTLDDETEDEGYVVEMAIPWASFKKAKRLPPDTQDTWRMNFYVVQNNAGAAWSPILGQGNFHKASRFGRVRFAK